VALSPSRREMDELQLKAAALGAKSVAAAALLLESQEQVKTAMEEVSVAYDTHHQRDVNNGGCD
jgi:hypothetical protein